MSSAHEWLARTASTSWPSVADHLWQTAVFVLVVLAATLLVKDGPARVRYKFWLLASAMLLVPTSLFAFLLGQAGIDFLTAIFNGQQHGLLVGGITAPVATLSSTYEFAVFASDPVRHNEIYCALTAVWLAGVVTLLVSWVWRRRSFVRVVKRGEHIRSGREWNALKSAMRCLNLTTNVQLVISRDKTEPTVCGFFRPVLLLPESVAEHLDDDELETIMLHELVHIVRRDNLVGSLQMMVCALFWFFPPVWFISRKLFDEREQACDEKVLEVYGAPERYATSILKVVRFCFGWKVAGLPGAGGGSNLRRRIENIMTTNYLRNGTGVGTRRLAAVFVGMTLVLMVAAGVYSSAAETHSTRIVSELTGSVEDGDSLPITSDNYSAQTTKRDNTAPPSPPQNPQPPSPPQDMQPPSQPQDTQPPSPPSDVQPPSQPSQPPSPPQDTQPPSQPPTAPAPATPPTPQPAPAAPASPQDKSSDKKNEESSQEKKDVRVKGKLIEAPRPEYPKEARDKKIEGSVAVRIVIGEEGKVISARATSGPEILHEASIAAALKARFEPSTVNGKPAKVVGTMTYDFRLDQN